MDSSCSCEAPGPPVLNPGPLPREERGPLRCGTCNGDLDLDSLEPSEQARAAVERFHECFDGLFFAWFLGGENAEAAAVTFDDKDAEVHRLGLAAAEAIGARYAWFATESDPMTGRAPKASFDACPNCGGSLSPLGRWMGCDRCVVAVPSGG